MFLLVLANAAHIFLSLSLSLTHSLALLLSLLLSLEVDGAPLTDADLRLRVTEWCANPVTTEASHGDINDWDVSNVQEANNLRQSEQSCKHGEHV